MKMKPTCPVALLAATSALFLTSAPLRATETDNRIEESVNKSYVFKTYLKDDAITLQSKDGVVTLTGTVSEQSHRSLAQDTVESQSGVKSVDNQLKVKGENAELSDQSLSRKVKTTLSFHRNLSALGTVVDVKDGIVSLSGEALNQAQKELTAEYTRDIEGVKEVKNEMTISAIPATPAETVDERIDDASITAQVKTSLLSHRSTSALKPKVGTTDGVVTLSGIARNATDKLRVTRLVTDINGVKSVINYMTLEAGVSKSNTPPRPVQNLRIVNN